MKQVIAVRQDLQLPKGKLAAQVAHAAVQATLRSSDENVQTWKQQGQKKVVVKVKDEAHLLEIQQQAKAQGLIAALITDAGKTVIAPGTKTCVAIGPDKDDKVDKLTKDLALM